MHLRHPLEPRTPIIVSLFAAVLLHGAAAFAGSSINASNQHAYGANTGWITARADITNGAVIGQFFCSGYLYGANVGWISLGRYPTNGFRYTNAGAQDFGVNHDGLGRLSGYAWGQNIGWIAFETNGNPRVNLLTGQMDGYAWGQNVGWISMSNTFAYVQTDYLANGNDKDEDGIPDPWELANTTDLDTLGPSPADRDEDGEPDVNEYLADTDPRDEGIYLRVTAIERRNPTNLVTWTVQPTRFYRLEQASSAVNGAVWTDSGLGLLTPPGDFGPTLTGSMIEPSATTRFYRARAVVPLSP